MDPKDANVTQEQQQQQPEQAAPKPNLILVVKGKNTETTYTLEEGKEFVIGADPLASIPVDDDFLSTRHFSVKAEDGKVEVKDLGSRNGLFLKIAETQVSPGQTLLAGKTFLRVEEQKDERV